MAQPTSQFNPSDSEVRAALDVLARCLLSVARDQERAGIDPTWINQHRSPMGNRRHCAACRARIAVGAVGAAIVGRQFLMTAEAVEAELARPRTRKKPTASCDDTRALAAELGLKLVAGDQRRPRCSTGISRGP
jgi:hypothetical protein